MWKSADHAPSLRILPWHLPYNWGKSTENLSQGKKIIRHIINLCTKWMWVVYVTPWIDVSGIRHAMAIFLWDRAPLSLNAWLVCCQRVKLHLTENKIFLNLRHNHDSCHMKVPVLTSEGTMTNRYLWRGRCDSFTHSKTPTHPFILGRKYYKKVQNH
jgi:hypothetical protein